MSKARLKKVESILSKLRKQRPDLPPGVASNLIITHGETYEERQADGERQLAALREKGYEGPVIILPDNGRDSPALPHAAEMLPAKP